MIRNIPTEVNFLLELARLKKYLLITLATTKNLIYTLKKSLSIVKLRSFQNASIEIKQISFVSQ